ncbi:hypothetical protein NMY22_g5927 [Coprinellus aureogranulatus]|nr:hypothetical protein NMY22_g5927 [Coprinellus aureogranulatus]
MTLAHDGQVESESLEEQPQHEQSQQEQSQSQSPATSTAVRPGSLQRVWNFIQQQQQQSHPLQSSHMAAESIVFQLYWNEREVRARCGAPAVKHEMKPTLSVDNYNRTVGEV